MNPAVTMCDQQRVPTSVSFHALEFELLPLTDPVQVNLVGDSNHHHDPNHRTQSCAEHPQGV